MSIVVIGSINMDLVTKTTKFPKVGETIIGDSFHTFCGGKGSNQAVCASRLGADVRFIGCVGNDTNGTVTTTNLSSNGVDASAVLKLDNETTGIAQITIAENDNSIILIQGANNKVTTEIIDDNLDILQDAELVLLQLEIPLETVKYVVDICYKNGITTVLNPAPAMVLSKDLINKVNYITPNEIEYDVIFKENYENGLKKYPNKLIVTRGAMGVDYHNGMNIVTIKALPVDVVDTTGAGDSFNGAFCVGLINGMSIFEAITYGNKIASISVKKLGAQSSMPYVNEVL